MKIDPGESGFWLPKTKTFVLQWSNDATLLELMALDPKQILIRSGGGSMDDTLQTCEYIVWRKIPVYLHGAISAGTYYSMLNSEVKYVRNTTLSVHGSGSHELKDNPFKDSLHNVACTVRKMALMPDTFDKAKVRLYRSFFEAHYFSKPDAFWKDRHPSSFYMDLVESPEFMKLQRIVEFEEVGPFLLELAHVLSVTPKS